MRYAESRAVNEVYELIARLYEPEAGPAEAKPDQAFTVAGALVELGEANSWASVWFAYGALHYDLSDEALVRALELLDQVDASAPARAAALMLKAEAAFSLAIYREDEPDRREQVALLDEAVELAPDWPSLQHRLARALDDVKQHQRAKQHARTALALLEEGEASTAPFDALTGRFSTSAYVREDLATLGLVERSA